MLTKPSTIAVLLLFFNALYAQDFSIKWGMPQKVQSALLGGSEVYEGHTDKHYYVTTRAGVKATLFKFDLNNALVYAKELDFGYKKTGLYLRSVYIIDNKPFLYLNKYSRSDETIEAYIQGIDESGTPTGQQLKLSTVRYEKRSVLFGAEFLFGSKFNTDAGGITQSFDGKKILFVTTSNMMETRKPENINITVLDPALKTLWTKDYSFPYDDRQLSVLDFKITNAGEVLILTKLYKSINDRESNTLNYRYRLFTISESGVKDHEIATQEDKEVFRSEVIMTRDEKLVIAGFYKDKSNTSKAANGVFYTSFDYNTGKVFSKTSYPFSAEVMQAFFGEKASEKEKSKGVQTLTISNLRNLNDTSIVML